MLFDNSSFYLESRFNYKEMTCYIGLLDLGFRDAYIEFDITKFNLSPDKLLDFIANKINVDITFSKESNEENKWIFGIDYGHIHNLYDEESMSKYFTIIYNRDKERIKERNELRKSFGTCFLGTQEIAEEDCRKIVDVLVEFQK